MEEEIRAIRLKYESQKAPIYVKRLAIVSGTVEPTKEEVPEDTDVEKEALKTAVAAALPAGGEQKGVPGFWLQALQSFGGLQDVADVQFGAELQHLLVLEGRADLSALARREVDEGDFQR